MLKAPCKNCQDRHYLCHSDCEKYLDFRKKQNAYNEAKYKEGQRDAEYIEYMKYSKKGRRS